MTRKTKALSGASQDAYFRRVLKAYPAIPEQARERIVRRLRREIAHLRVRPAACQMAEEKAELAAVEAADPTPVTARTVAIVPAAPAGTVVAAVPEPTAPGAFDPFAINVIVVLRTSGRAAALAALAAIDDADNLKRLAREQRLSVSDDLVSSAELSAAIIDAAERRIANRRAAAGSGRG